MFLSIITPVYNTGKYLPYCLDSCLEQGMNPEEYEIILIDDGSKDNSAEILDDYASRYSNLVVIHKVNEGVSVARNIALDLAKGEYIWFIDSDDFIEKNVLPDIYKLVQEHKPERISLNIYHMKSDFFTPEEEELYKEKKLIPGKRLICSAIYRADCINKNHTRFHPELTSNGDLVFTYELRKSIGGYSNEAEFAEPIVYYYRKNGNSITYTVSSKKLNSSINLSSIMYKHALEYKDGFAEYTMVRYLYFSYNGILQLPKTERKKWIALMREKCVYPIVVSSIGCEYYKDHYKTMKIRGISKLMFRWVPTAVGFYYVKIRSLFSRLLHSLNSSAE